MNFLMNFLTVVVTVLSYYFFSDMSVLENQTTEIFFDGNGETKRL